MKHLDDGLLQAWLDGPRSGMSASEHQEVRDHLARCEACRHRLEAVEATSERVASLLREGADDGADVPPYERVVARARHRRAAGHRRTAWTAAVWAGTVAAAAVVGWVANDLYTEVEPGAVMVDRTAPGEAGQGAVPPAAESSPGRTAASGQPDAGSEATVIADAESATSGGAEAEPGTSVVADAGPATSGGAEVEAATSVVADAGSATPEPAAARLRDSAAEATPRRALLRGRVTDEAGNPLRSAQVYVGGTNRGTLTNEDGAFLLFLDAPPPDSAPREVTLMAEFIGYGEGRRSLTLQGGDSLYTDIELPQQALALEELVVTSAAGSAQRREAAQARAAVARPVDSLALRRDPAPQVQDVEGWTAGSWTPGSWTPATQAEAEAQAGFQLLLVPELPVVAIQLRSVRESVWVRVLQALEGGGTLELVERTEVLLASADPDAEGVARVSMERDGVQIVATAPLRRGVLEALLARVR